MLSGKKNNNTQTDNKNTTTTQAQDAAQPAERNKAAEHSRDGGWNNETAAIVLPVWV